MFAHVPVESKGSFRGDRISGDPDDFEAAGKRLIVVGGKENLRENART